MRLVLPLSAAAVLLAACAPEPSTPSTPAPAASASASAPSPSATPTTAQQVVYSLDGLELVSGDTDATASFDDAAAVLSLLEDATGQLPEPTEIEDLPGYETDWVRFEWDGVDVRTDTGGVGVASVTVTGSTVDGIVIRTAGGLGVGSTRDELVGAGAQDGWDEDGDGIADVLRVGYREAPGTVSLEDPDDTGSLFIEFQLEDDVVTRFWVGDDFSDL